MEKTQPDPQTSVNPELTQHRPLSASVAELTRTRLSAEAIGRETAQLAVQRTFGEY